MKKDIIYEITIDSQPHKYLLKLSKKNKKNLKILLNAIKELSENPYNLIQLQGRSGKDRRIRKGDYRIIFSVNTNKVPPKIYITKIDKRSKIYKK
ncbi:MAG: type II toxin-antitoxin system RelE family toxin [Methanobacteriaceae archaeon]